MRGDLAVRRGRGVEVVAVAVAGHAYKRLAGSGSASSTVAPAMMEPRP